MSTVLYVVRSLFIKDILLLFLTSVLATLGLYKYVQWTRSRKNLYELSANVPYPSGSKPFPFIGHALYLMGNTEDILESVTDLSSRQYGLMKVWLAYRLFYIVNQPEHMEIVLNSPSCLSKDNLYKFVQSLGGQGLVTATDINVWKRHRKLAMPMFNQHVLDSYVEIFVEHANVLVQVISQCDANSINLEKVFSKYFLDVVCATTSGYECNSQLTDSEFERKINRGMEIGMTRMFNVHLHFDFIYKLTKYKKEEAEIEKYVKNMTEDIILSKKAEREHGRNINNDNRKILLHQMLELNEIEETLTLDEIRDEMSTFIIAGTDTSATAASFAIAMMSIYKDAQEKVYEEVMSVIGPNRQVEPKDLIHLKYTEMVIKESMRLFPIGPVIVRQVTKGNVKIDEFTIPEGAGLVLSIWALHRNPRIYEEPSKFVPERFTKEETAKRHRYSYIPFSGGPRGCIAVKYAMMSVKTVIATLVRRFKFESDLKSHEEIRVKQDFILKSVGGLYVRASPRICINNQ